MKFLIIDKSDTARWNEVWELYEKSFPKCERRCLDDHIRALDHPFFHPISAWEGEELIGIIFYWEWESYRYIEHFAVNAPLRGRGFGSQILRSVCNREYTILLEVDPLKNEPAMGRMYFFERTGFSLTPYRYQHLPYRKSCENSELLILTYPKMVTPEVYKELISFIEGTVKKFCEGFVYDEFAN